MSTMPAATVILSTYNHPQWLEKTLHGYACQDTRDFQVVIADDGSGPETRACIDGLRPQLPFPLHHTWQPDEGFRKCRALNLAIRAAGSDYLVFSDGDCIPRADFVATHLRLRRRGHFLSGGYCKLPLALSRAISVDDIRSGRATDAGWLRAHGMQRRTWKIDRHPPWRQRLLNALTPTRPRWHGHNASAWRDDIERVNGFDERMGYGAEDLEFGDRLENAGVRGLQIRFSAVCVHLEHDRGYAQPDMRAANERLRAQTRRLKLVRTDFGLDRHGAPDLA